MSARRRRWSVKLTDAAEHDFGEILKWTAATFGERQAEIYLTTLLAAIDALTDGPHVVGARARVDIASGLFALHVRRERRKGRHVLYFRLIESADEIEVLRILHDSMDAARHVKSDPTLE